MTQDEEFLRAGERLNKPSRRFQFRIRSLLLFTMLIGLLLSCIINLPAILSWAYDHWKVGKQYDQLTFEGSQFTLRITAYHERGMVCAAPGSYHRYEVKTASDWLWREIVMYRAPTPDPIAPNQFRRLSDSCAYFFQYDLFAITRDSGITWTFRGGWASGFTYPQFSAQQLDSHARIETFEIEEDGTGTLQLSNYDYVKMSPLPSQEFETSDFGATWDEVQAPGH